MTVEDTALLRSVTGVALFRAEAERIVVEWFEGNKSSSEMSPSPNITDRLYIITVEQNSSGCDATEGCMVEAEAEDSSKECTELGVKRILAGWFLPRRKSIHRCMISTLFRMKMIEFTIPFDKPSTMPKPTRNGF
jgi:hypothetical protein